MTTTQLVTCYVLAGLAEVIGIALAAVEVQRTLNDLRARPDGPTWQDMDRLNRLELERTQAAAPLRLLAVALLLGGVTLGTIANIASATTT